MPAPSLIDRRRFLTGSAAIAAAALVWRPSPLRANDEPVSFTSTPFTLGVGSGDPLPDRVVLWTRLHPATASELPDEDVLVDWEMSLDPSFGALAASGSSTAPAAFAHSVHVDAAGLEPDTWYFYRFRVGGHTSPIGRTRTAPANDADVDRMAFGFVSCQNYGNGFFNAHHFMSQEDLDLVFHLGDYIYESTGSRIRPVTGGEANTLARYRDRYALYRSDADLQAAHQSCPWVVVWDDHEVDNDYANDISQDNDPVEAFLVRRAEAYLAWWEHQAVRMPAPVGPDLPIHRSFDWGRLARFIALDTRQYRSDQCGVSPGAPCSPDSDQDRTILGADQEAWLADQLTSSTATWNVLAQQVIVAAVNIGRLLPNNAGLYNLDQWDGYPSARQRLLDVLALPEVRNPLVITGDIHSSGASYLLRRFDETPRARIVGHELIGTSVSSSFPAEAVGIFLALPSFIEWLRYVNPAKRGYVTVKLTPEAATARWRTVSTIDVHHSTAEGAVTVDTDQTWEIPAVAADDAEPRFLPAGFADVPAGSYFDQAVNWLKVNGITTGFGGSASAFAPQVVVNRGQMAAFLWRMMGQPGGAPEAGFTDVADDAFFADAVDWLKAAGITTGVGGSTTLFRPTEPVTRGQMAVFLWRMAGSPTPAAPAPFADVAATAFFRDAVGWLLQHGITTGFGGSPTTFAPDRPVTRAQMAAFLFRLARTPGAWAVAMPPSTEF